MDFVLGGRGEVRSLAGKWLLVALSALALSTACAVLLVIGRLPLPEVFTASVGWFRRALVLHVNLAVVVWFLTCAAGLWTLAAGGRAGLVRWLALILAATGMLAMVLALFDGSATPVLANYVPVLDSTVFLTGLALFFAGVVVSGLMSGAVLIGRLRREAVEVWRIGALWSIGATAVAAAGLAAALLAMGAPADAAGFELLAWGPGHVLQFVHILLLMSVWIILGEHALGAPVAGRGWLLIVLGLAALPLLAVLPIYVLYSVDSAEFRLAFTDLMRWTSWPAAALLALRLLWQLTRAGRDVLRSQVPLLLSILLFLFGCLLGALIRGDSTMVPAHYHGTVGAVTLAYMTLGYQLLEKFGFKRAQGFLARWQPVVYGLGLMVLASALAWSGWLGVPRKTLHVDVIVQYPAYFAAMGLAGVGGFFAICGAALFVFNIFRSIRGGLRGDVKGSQPRDVRLPAILLALGVTVVTGFLLAYWPSDRGNVVAEKLVDPRQDGNAHAAQMRKQEVASRFAKGVALLSQNQFEAAAGDLHRVLELAPQMPEAHVNMGFAMIGLQKHAMARHYFDSAIDLNVDQLNAYYGLAMSLEALGDVGGALGAMRTYVHLSKSDDPFLRKANSAIWEWEEDLRLSRQAAVAAPPNQPPAGQTKP